MTLSTVAIPAAFLILAACLSWIVAKSNGHWAVKGALILASIFSSFGIWASMSDIEGWPMVGAPKGDFEMIAAIVSEPSKDDPGFICLWVSSYVDSKDHPWATRFRETTPGEPRSYRMPYSEKMHEKIQQAMADMKAGRRVLGRIGQRQPRQQKGEQGVADYEYDMQLWYPLPPGGSRKTMQE